LDALHAVSATGSGRAKACCAKSKHIAETDPQAAWSIKTGSGALHLYRFRPSGSNLTLAAPISFRYECNSRILKAGKFSLINSVNRNKIIGRLCSKKPLADIWATPLFLVPH
jgi:hypothetical protein